MLLLVFHARRASRGRGVARSNRWAWRGLFRAIYIAISILPVPRLGTAAVVALRRRQMLASLIFDHYGLLGVAQHPATLSRVVGAALLAGGVILVRLRSRDRGSIRSSSVGRLH